MDSDQLFRICFPLTCSGLIWGGVGAGWIPTIAKALQQIEAENHRRLHDSLDGSPHLITVGQIKEKFASARIYLDSSDEWASALIDSTEKACNKLCEECGANATTRVDQGWYRIVCEKCRPSSQPPRVFAPDEQPCPDDSELSRDECEYCQHGGCEGCGEPRNNCTCDH